MKRAYWKEAIEVCSSFQIWFPFMGRFRSVVNTETELEENLYLIHLARMTGEFLYRVKGNSNWQDNINLAASGKGKVSFTISGDELAEILELVNALCACGEPATIILNCSCGNYAWCDKCFEYVGPGEVNAPPSAIFWNHADHNCSSECCAKGHQAPEITLAELRAMVDPLEIQMREIRSFPEGKIFLVSFQPKTQEDILKEMEYYAMDYSRVIDENGKKIPFDLLEENLKLFVGAVV